MKTKNPCEDCTKCCEYLAVEIDKPRSKKEFDDIIWYVLHNVRIPKGILSMLKNQRFLTKCFCLHWP